jgi:hypothetical protein
MRTLAIAGRSATVVKLNARVTGGTIENLQRGLLERMTDRNADLRACIEAGLRLGELGDPRFEQSHGPYGDYLMPPLIARNCRPGTSVRLKWPP